MLKVMTITDKAIKCGITYREAYDKALKGEFGRIERRGNRLVIVGTDKADESQPAGAT